MLKFFDSVITKINNTDLGSKWTICCALVHTTMKE